MLKPVKFIPVLILLAFVYSQTALANLLLKNYEEVHKACATVGSPLEDSCAQPDKAFEIIKTTPAKKAYVQTMLVEAISNKQDLFINCTSAKLFTSSICKPVAASTNQQAHENSVQEQQEKVAAGLACEKPPCKEKKVNSQTKAPVHFESHAIKNKNYGGDKGESVYTKSKNSDGTYTTTVSKDGKEYAQIYENEKGKISISKMDENGNASQKIDGKEARDLKKHYKTLEEKKENALAKTKDTNNCANGKGDADCEQKDLKPEQKEEINQASTSADQTIENLNQAVRMAAQDAFRAAQTAVNDQLKKQACTAIISKLNSGVNTKIQDLQQPHKACITNSKVAGFVCPIIISPAAQMATVGLNAATALLNGLSTTDTCKITSVANMTSQSLMVVGGLTCGISKGKCENRCKDAVTLLATIENNISTIASSEGAICSEAMSSLSNAAKLAGSFKTENTNKLTKCETHKLDIMQMASMAANMGAASAQAKACADKVGLEASSAGLASVSAAAGCNDPSNATYSTQTCVCQRDNTAYGCAGYVGSINGGAVGKIGSSSGVSQMAGTTSGTKLNDSGLTGMNDLGGSDNGWNGIGGNPSAEQQDLSFGKAGSASVGGGGGAGGGGTGAPGSEKHLGEEPGKDGLAGKYGNSFGGFGGRGAGAAGRALQNQKYSEAQLAAAKRKLASDQANNQVSSASGFSNWDKVKTRYLENKSTLIGN